MQRNLTGLNGHLGEVADAPQVSGISQSDDGYTLHFEPPWENFPGESVEEDTARMNRELERWVLRLPTQYFWTHKRFKTRPEGEASLY